MARLVFDTSVFINYKPDLPAGSLLSVVVVQELMAGVSDKSELKAWEATARKFNQEGRLLFPATEDWLMAGRAVNSLLRGPKTKSGGKVLKVSPADSQRIIRDVLIARTVMRAGCVLVTDNLADFKQIKKFCDVRLLSGKYFFSA
jgi:predicted nucleic acid-binding protein